MQHVGRVHPFGLQLPGAAERIVERLWINPIAGPPAAWIELDAGNDARLTSLGGNRLRCVDLLRCD